MKVSPSFCFFLALMVLLHHPVAALNWQGTGTFTDSNITYIWSFIERNIQGYFGEVIMQRFASDLSTHLNTAWDPAWNVVVAPLQDQHPTYNDVILYAYAFKNHWMWYNGHNPFGSYTFSYVIWKDYNCQNWKDIGKDAAPEDRYSGFTGDQKGKISGLIGTHFNTASLMTDPWGQAKLFVDALQADSDFVVSNNHAYSIVVSTAITPTGLQGLYGRVCVVSNKYYYSPFDYSNPLYRNQSTGKSYGFFMLIQTR